MDCSRDFKDVIDERKRGVLWAKKLWDSWGRIPDGILEGNKISFGDFDECRSVHFDTKASDVRGKYCLMELLQNRNEQADANAYQIGVCVPSTCAGNDTAFQIQKVLQNFTRVLDDNTSSTVKIDEYACSEEMQPTYTAGTICVITIIAVLLLATIVATALDLYANYFNSDKLAGSNRGVKSLLAFSLYENVSKFLDTTTPKGDLSCLHGLRFMSATWVVLVHTWYMATVIPIKNPLRYIEERPKWSLHAIFVGDLAVDTFMVLSGLLLCYVTFRKLDSSDGVFNYPKFYIHRYFRLTPPYALFIAFVVGIMPILGSGPLWWMMIKQQVEPCLKNWWVNLIYMNNFINLDNICVGESWYLAVDMQLYWVSPLVFYPLWRWPNFGAGLVLLLIVAVSLCNGLITYFLQLMPSGITSPNIVAYFQQLYMRPYTRAAPFLVGMALGAFIRRRNGQNMKPPKVFIVLGWVSSVATCLAVVYGLQPYYAWNSPPPSVSLSAAYNSLHRLAWALSIAWLIYACLFGFGGPVNAFLSWKVFVPLGKLAYGIYLVSLHVQLYYHLTQRTVMVYDWYSMMYLYFSHLIASLLAAFVLSICAEMPFMKLDAIWISPKTKKIIQTEQK